MITLHNQTAVITGAGRGIGQAVAVSLAELGARVVLAARSRSELEDTARQIGAGMVAPTDIRKKEEIVRLFEQAGPVDILVNAAGIGIMGRVVDFREEDYEATLDTNLRGIFLTCRHVLPSMIERRTGHIVNIASIAGKVGTANRAVYCASKFGVVGFSQALAEEVREHGVRVSVVCPGSTDTAFSDSRPAGSAIERMLTPRDVAHAIRMIVTQEPNSFISEIVMRPTRKP